MFDPNFLSPFIDVAVRTTRCSTLQSKARSPLGGGTICRVLHMHDRPFACVAVVWRHTSLCRASKSAAAIWSSYRFSLFKRMFPRCFYTHILLCVDIYTYSAHFVYRICKRCTHPVDSSVSPSPTPRLFVFGYFVVKHFVPEQMVAGQLVAKICGGINGRSERGAAFPRRAFHLRRGVEVSQK